MKKRITFLQLAFIFLATTSAQAAPKYPEAIIPDNVVAKDVTVWSDGRALDATIYRPKGLNENEKLPAIVTSHGWGGDKKTASRYAVKFAKAGFIAITFTHNSWGESQGNLLIKNVQQQVSFSQSNINVHMVRKIIDPVDWTQNFRSVVDYLVGEPNVDSSKIGGWGTSFGGGIAANAAAYDDRISSLVLQVAAFPVLSGAQLLHAKNRAVEIARGKVAAIPENLDSIPGLEGTPHFARFLQYKPLNSIELLEIPTLFISAGAEDLFKNEENSARAYEILKSKNSVKTSYHEIPEINHYGIYFQGYEVGSELAVNWFKETL